MYINIQVQWDYTLNGMYNLKQYDHDIIRHEHMQMLIHTYTCDYLNYIDEPREYTTTNP